MIISLSIIHLTKIVNVSIPFEQCSLLKWQSSDLENVSAWWNCRETPSELLWCTSAPLCSINEAHCTGFLHLYEVHIVLQRQILNFWMQSHLNSHSIIPGPKWSHLHRNLCDKIGVPTSLWLRMYYKKRENTSKYVLYLCAATDYFYKVWTIYFFDPNLYWSVHVLLIFIFPFIHAVFRNISLYCATYF